jgi:glycosyltransferase involved in cell wall biosynthesis
MAHIRNNWFAKHKPVGGVKVGYQHCMLLSEAGFSAYPLLLGRYHGNFFGYDVETKHIDDPKYQLNQDDVVIIPEYTPYLGAEFNCNTKIMFVQNRPYKNFTESDEGKSYKALGYDAIWYVSSYLGDMLYDEDMSISHYIPNFINQDAFIPDASRRVEGRVLAMPRKNRDDLKAIQRQLEKHNVDFMLVDGLSEAELISEYQAADIFLATGYPEGFGLPPLEAMACGCAVVGFTGGGANEFMSDGDTALVSADGDVQSAASQLLQLLSDNELKEKLRNKGMSISRSYSEHRTQEALVSAVNKL